MSLSLTQNNSLTIVSLKVNTSQDSQEILLAVSSCLHQTFMTSFVTFLTAGWHRCHHVVCDIPYFNLSAGWHRCQYVVCDIPYFNLSAGWHRCHHVVCLWHSLFQLVCRMTLMQQWWLI